MNKKLFTYRKVRKGLKFVLNGHSSVVWNQIRHRLYSTSYGLGLQRNLHQEFTPRSAKVDLSVRVMKDGDAEQILDHEVLKRSFPQLVDKRKKLVEANIPDCYVAVTGDDTPCYMQWLIGPEHNEQIQSYFGNTFPKLEEDEALLEGAFANPDFRGKGVMPEAMSKITERATNLGVNKVITFVGLGNIPSLKGCKRAGFSPYILKEDQWYMLQRDISFREIPEDILSQYNEATGGK